MKKQSIATALLSTALLGAVITSTSAKLKLQLTLSMRSGANPL